MPKSSSKKPLIIVFVGEKLAGKEVAARYLATKYSFNNLRFSKILVDMLGILRLPISRANELALAGALRERFGSGVLAEVLKREIEDKRYRRVVLDGLRHPAELEILKRMPGFLLVYLTAPLELRFYRARARGEKAGERHFTLDDFKREEKMVTEVFIRRMGRAAHVTLANTGTLKQLYQQIEEKIVRKHL